MGPKIEKLLGGFRLAEGPHWDIASQSLYFVDINEHSIHKYVPTIEKHTSANLGKIFVLYSFFLQGYTNIIPLFY